MSDNQPKPSARDEQPSHSARTGRIVFGTIVGVIVFLFLTAGSALGYEYWLGGRVMHNVSYAGTSVATLDSTSLQAEIITRNAQLVSLVVPVTFQGSTIAVPLSSFDPEFDVQTTVEKILIDSSMQSPWNQFIMIVSTLWKQRDYQPMITLHQVPPQIATLVSSATYAGSDATFQLIQDNQLTIIPEKNGVALDANTLLTTVEQNVFVGDPIEVTVMNVRPNVTAESLQAIVSPMTDIVSAPLTLTLEGRDYAVSPAALLASTQLDGANGQWQVSLREAALQSTFDTIGKSVERAAKPRQVNAVTGEVLSEGQSGTAIDRATTMKSMTDALQGRLTISNKTTSVVIATSVVQPTDQKVQLSTTPGMYPGKYIEVDLSSQRLYAYEGEALIHEYRVSTGKWSTPTPVGTYAITNKSPRAYSKPYDLYMPYWMGFIGSKYGFHELPEWPDGRKEGESHIGTPVSHGCIRLGVGDAQALYEWGEIGVPVVVHK